MYNAIFQVFLCRIPRGFPPAGSGGRHPALPVRRPRRHDGVLQHARRGVPRRMPGGGQRGGLDRSMGQLVGGGVE